MMQLTTIQLIAVAALPLLFAITVHEVAHGWVANRLGDKTALMMGRLTLNPLKHIDPVGTIIVPLLMIVLTSFAIGWAKPVPVDWRNLRHPKRDMAIVAVAGPLANLAMALLWAVAAKIGTLLSGSAAWMSTPLILMGQIGIFLNAIFMVINLIPIPPLDGGRVATGLLPARWAIMLARVEPYGLFILIALLVTGYLGKIVGPPIGFIERVISALVGI